MLVHRGQRREAETAADLFQARRIAVLLDEFVQVIEDLALSFGQRKHAMSLIANEDAEHYTQKKGEGQLQARLSGKPVAQKP